MSKLNLSMITHIVAMAERLVAAEGAADNANDGYFEVDPTPEQVAELEAARAAWAELKAALPTPQQLVELDLPPVTISPEGIENERHLMMVAVNTQTLHFYIQLPDGNKITLDRDQAWALASTVFEQLEPDEDETGEDDSDDSCPMPGSSPTSH